MKKKFNLFALLIIMIFSLTGCSKSFNTVDQIKEKGTLVVATNAEFPPFEYLDGSTFKGIDMDVIKLYGDYLGVEVEIKNMDFDASLLSTSTFKSDLAIAAITKNAKREETLSFSDSYYQANQVVVVKEDSIYANLTTQEEILNALTSSKAKIGCQRGTTGEYYIKGSPDWDFDGIANTTCVTYDNGALAMTDLVKGNIQAIVIDEAPAMLYEKKFNGVKKLDVVLTQEEYCIAVARGNESLVTSLNTFIEQIKTDGSFDKVINSYFGDGDQIEIEDTKPITNHEAYLSILKGLGITFMITCLAFLIGIFLGLLTGIIEGIESDNAFAKIVKGISKVYVSIFRGTPVAVQLLIIYYVVFSSINPVLAAVITFGLNSGAYVSEIVRGGISSLPRGQMEAGRSLGLSYPTVMKKVILPQAVTNCLPSLGNEFVSLIKETSVVSFITVIDLYAAFRAIATASFNYKGVYLIMGVVYFVIVYLISFLLKLLEKRLMKHVKAK